MKYDTSRILHNNNIHVCQLLVYTLSWKQNRNPILEILEYLHHPIQFIPVKEGVHPGYMFILKFKVKYTDSVFTWVFPQLCRKTTLPNIRQLTWTIFLDNCPGPSCVTLVGRKSTSFRISNGTRQELVISPALFSVYLDDLLQELRNLGLGCQIGRLWMEACGYGDDLLLLAQVRSVLQDMVTVCEQYGARNNLLLSTDSNTAKPKTKCMLLCGRLTNVVYPPPIKLDDMELPWVVTADHLSHTMHQLVWK